MALKHYQASPATNSVGVRGIFFKLFRAVGDITFRFYGDDWEETTELFEGLGVTFHKPYNGFDIIDKNGAEPQQITCWVGYSQLDDTSSALLQSLGSDAIKTTPVSLDNIAAKMVVDNSLSRKSLSMTAVGSDILIAESAAKCTTVNAFYVRDGDTFTIDSQAEVWGISVGPSSEVRVLEELN